MLDEHLLQDLARFISQSSTQVTDLLFILRGIQGLDEKVLVPVRCQDLAILKDCHRQLSYVVGGLSLYWPR